MTVGVGILGATNRAAIAEVGQRAFSRLADHPALEVRGVLADDPDDVGKRFGDVVAERWILPDEQPPQKWLDAPLLGLDARDLSAAGIDMVVSGLAAPRSAELEPQIAALGIPVISGSGGLRMDADVPLVVAGVNSNHLDLVQTQMETRGWNGGFVAVGPLCTAALTAVVMKPIHDAFGVTNIVATTMQAISGTGLSGLPAMKILDNVLPYIQDEEEKMSRELAKVFGTLDGGKIDQFTAPISSTCTRVPVRNGHTISLTLGLESSASVDEIENVLREFRGDGLGADSPLTPDAPIAVMDDPLRPQPALDIGTGKGRVVSVGRVRQQAVFDNGIGLVIVGHNHERGTWGNVLMLCEAVVARGLVG